MAGDPYPQQVRLRVQGRGLRHGAVLVFDGKRVPTTFVSKTQLQAAVPFNLMEVIVWRNPSKGLDSFHGTVAVVIRNPSPHPSTSKATSFVVRAWPIE